MHFKSSYHAHIGDINPHISTFDPFYLEEKGDIINAIKLKINYFLVYHVNVQLIIICDILKNKENVPSTISSV